MDNFLHAAIAEAELGAAEGGIPIGSVLVHNGAIIGRGHNRRVQRSSAVLHAEMDALEQAGRQPAAIYRASTLYTTLSPCAMCSGAILLYGIPRVVVGENRTFLGEEALLVARGVAVDVRQDERCQGLMTRFIAARPDLWNEDIGASLPEAALRVQRALDERGVTVRVRELPASTRTAQEAAAAIGCSVSQIVKSLVFRTASGNPLLVLASGTNRVDETAVSAIIGESIRKADAEFVRDRTGFPIGGVAPLGHRTALPTLIDEDLLQYEEVWAAAGTPHGVFPVAPTQLVASTGGRVTRVTKA